MEKNRKVNDVWNAIDDQRINAKIKQIEWRRSYDGIKAAMEFLGYQLITTQEELDSMEIPIYKKNNNKNYTYSPQPLTRRSLRSHP
jgi:hypothetical protein